MNNDIEKKTTLFLEEQRLDNLFQTQNTEKRNLFYQNIFSLRTFLITLIGFSLTIIGIVLSILLSSKNILLNSCLTYIGLILLGLNVIGSICYILYIYTIEVNAIYKQIKFNDSLIKKLKDLIREVLNNPNKTSRDYTLGNKEIMESSLQEEKEIIVAKNCLTIKGKDWTPHLLCGLFILGILLLVISFLITR